MSVELTKKEKRDERQQEKVRQVANELQSALLSFRSKIHKMLQEPVGGAIASYHPARISPTSPGHKITPFVQGEVIEPLEPIKIGKNTKLVIKDSLEFKEPIVSPKMQKNLRCLELRLDAKGHLYSPKSFDPEWNWQTQAIWLRTIGLGYLQISDKVGKSNNTVKSMFKRLGITKFFGRTSKLDYATIGYGGANTPSGWRAIKKGGSPDIQYLPGDMVVNSKTGLLEPLYKVKFNIGEHVLTSASTEYKVQTQPFKFGIHKKEVHKRNIEALKRKIQVNLEQEMAELENLQRNIEKGFDPETGKYMKEKIIK